ncbi:hypothetical protein ABW20_dc0105823 [Dactylellina cionopaga]|nr:hypothetical protein ABW20_dc0105823 [Dactylellina cionopaga]
MFAKTELLSIIQATQNLSLDVSGARIIPIKSGGGVCSRKVVADGLRDVIDNEKDRTTFGELSKLLDVDDKYISAVLSTLTEDEWGVNGRQVVLKQPFAILENDLRGQLKGGLVTVVKYCLDKDVQLEFLKKLVGYLKREWGVEVCWLGGERYIYSIKYFEDVVDKVKVELEEAVEPADFENVSIIKSTEYPAEFCHRIVKRVIADNDLDGLWVGNTFIPTAYKQKRQDEALRQLQDDGFIAHKTLKRVYIDKPDVFLADKFPDVTMLSSHYVTQNWLERVDGEAAKTLDGFGFASIQELAGGLTSEEQTEVQNRFKKKQTRKLLEHGGHLVTRDLVDELIRIGLAYAKEEAEKAWTAAVERSKMMSLSTTLPWRSLCNFLALDRREVPPSALESIAQSILPKVSGRYVDRANELREAANTSAKLHFTDKIYLRFIVNMAALERIQDAGLQDKLAQDLLAYYQKTLLEGLVKLLDRMADSQSKRKNDQIGDTIESVNNACSSDTTSKAMGILRSLQDELRNLMRVIGAEEPSAEITKAKKVEMQRELKTQLDKATDPSLMMLVVLILLFSELEDGILRATGKYAPKLLKILKPKMEEGEYQFLSSVKSAVIARTSVGGEDVERLRGIIPQYEEDIQI